MEKIQLIKREGSPAKIRKDGNIPVCIYRKDYSKNSAINYKNFYHLIKIKGYSMLSTIFTLHDEETKEDINVIIKEIKFHPISENVTHVDFFKVQDNEEFIIPAKVVLHNAEKALFTKEGGIPYLPRRTIKVICTTKKMVSEIVCDVMNLHKGDVIQTTDKIWLDSGIKFTTNEPLVTIVEKS